MGLDGRCAVKQRRYIPAQRRRRRRRRSRRFTAKHRLALIAPFAAQRHHVR